MNSLTRPSSLKRRTMIGLVVGIEGHETGVRTTISLHLAIVNGITENAVLLHLLMTGLVVALVVTETGVRTIISHLQVTVNGVMENVILLHLLQVIVALVALIRIVLTAMTTVTRTVTDVSVQRVKAANQVPIVEMDKAVSGCVATTVANLVPYLKWPWTK
jgi:hypothetical protein